MRIFDSGQGRSETGAVVHGGLLVQATGRAELVELIRLGLRIRAQREPWHPRPLQEAEGEDSLLLRRIHGRLMAGDARVEDDDRDDGWREALMELCGRPPAGAFDGLLAALANLLEFWEDDTADAQPRHRADQPELLLMLASPSPREDQPAELRFEAPRAALVIRNGSLIVGLSLATIIKATRWCAAVVTRVVPRSPQAAARRMVQGARDIAQRSCRHNLPRLDRLQPVERQALLQRRMVIVLLHGLFGTDLLTFDGLISRFKSTRPQDLADPAALTADQLSRSGRSSSPTQRLALHELLQPLAGSLQHCKGSDVGEFIDAHVAFVGWPHNSLASIEENARHLADLIENELTPDGPALVFVGHSRGGLVARACAARLLERSTLQRDWGRSLSRIVTFGTPHEGAAMAEPTVNGARDLATYLMMLNATRRWSSLVDVLGYLQSRTSEGIESLKPPEASTGSRQRAFISDLFDSEGRLRGADGRRRPPVIAVGGKVDAAVLDSWRKRAANVFVSRQIDDDDHDLVVELSSSISDRLKPEAAVIVACDHFGYFDTDGEALHAIDEVLSHLWAGLVGALGSWLASRPPAAAGGLVAPPRASFKLMRPIKVNPRK